MGYRFGVFIGLFKGVWDFSFCVIFGVVSSWIFYFWCDWEFGEWEGFLGFFLFWLEFGLRLGFFNIVGSFL